MNKEKLTPMEQLLRNFNLLNNIVRQTDKSSRLPVDTTQLEEIIDQKLPEAIRKNAPENIYKLYGDFQAEYERFCDFLRYSQLIGKNVVALGGGFSSGKSSFLNALMGHRAILPAKIDPSTSVPTYVLWAEDHHVEGVNAFNAKVTMEPCDIKALAHGFAETYDDDEDGDGARLTQAVPLGHLLKSLFLATPFHRFKELAFLDTPGYSKPSSEQYTERTDGEIALQQLNASNFIIWFIRAESGTITDEDIKFIQQLRPDIEKMVIVNKADEKDLESLKAVILRVKEVLLMKGIAVTGVHPFSNKTISDPDLAQFVESGAEQIEKQLLEWEKREFTPSFAWNFKKLFVECESYYDKEVQERSVALGRLNHSMTRLDTFDPEVCAPLDDLIKTYQAEIGDLKNAKDALISLQEEFFTALNGVAGIVGVSLPEPSKIELLKGNQTDPLKLLRTFQKGKAGSVDDRKAFTSILEETFKNVEPKLDHRPGGAAYAGELAAVLKAAAPTGCIRFYDPDSGVKKIAEALQAAAEEGGKDSE